MSEPVLLGSEHDCYYATDPRINKDLSVAGKNCIVAGAGRGVGRACARFFAHASAKSITLVAIEQEEVEETGRLCKEINASVQILTAAFDVTNAKKVQSLLDTIDKEFGGVDVLHMNAGRPPQWLSTVDCDPTIWWDTVAVSLQGAFNFSRFSLPSMQRKKEGVIIFTSSNGAHSNFGMGSYAVGKLGMVRLAETIHNENFKEYNIKAFAFNPGCVRTRFYTDFKDKVDGIQTEGTSYLLDGIPNEEKSAHTAVDTLKDVTWDTPEMAAGLVIALAAGKLNFMSGRYVDASKNIEEYIKDRDLIVKRDLHRVRLHAGIDTFIPTLDF